MKRMLLIFLICSVTCASGIGQIAMPAVINVSGGSSKSGNTVYEWSIGEPALINEMRSPDEKTIITNGFLQTYGFIAIKDSVAKPFYNGQIRILPNPTKGWLQLNLSLQQLVQFY